MIINKFLNRSSVIVQERSSISSSDHLLRDDILLLNSYECTGDHYRNNMNIELEMAMQQKGRSGIVLRFIKMDIYYLALEVHWITIGEVEVSLIKYIYNNRWILDKTMRKDWGSLGEWNRLMITMSGALIQVLLVHNGNPSIVISRTV